MQLIVAKLMKSSIHTLTYENFTWIDSCQPNKEQIDHIAETHQLDYFQIKDSLEHGHLPKFERLPDYNFIILRAFTANPKQGASTVYELSNKIAFFYTDKKLITIHRNAFAFLTDVQGDFRYSDELLLYIVHNMLASYQAPLDALDDKIASIEQVIFLKNSTKISLQDLYFLRTQTRITKKLLQLFQGVINQLEVRDSSKTALQDIKDKLLSLLLRYDEVAENANNLLSTYLSVNAQKSNEVMKLLTIFSAFFLPLTFVAGIYGMNFNNMPELTWQSGYFYTLGLMVLIALIIYIWFKRKQIL